MEWYGNRYEETFRYVKVSPTDWTELEEYPFITNGSIEWSEDNKNKVTGSFNYTGTELPDVGHYLRVYYSFEDEYGNHDEVALATLIPSISSTKIKETSRGVVYSGSFTGNSLLTILENKKYGEPFVVKKNENAIYKAATLIEEFGLRVDYEPDRKVMSADHTFSEGTSYLDIINWLCGVSNYRDAFVDKYGVIQLKQNMKPEVVRNPFVFKNDKKSIMYPELDNNNDWQDRANVVKLLYNTESACILAVAKNESGSRMSLRGMRNREITYFENIGELDRNNKVLELTNMAEEKLREEATETEYVTFQHAYIPMDLKKAVKIEYEDLVWVGSVENMSIDLSPSIKTQTKIKKTIEANIVITKSAKTFRGA